MAVSMRQPTRSFGISAVDDCFSKAAMPVKALHEVRAGLARDFASATGFVLGLVMHFSQATNRKVMWIIDPASASDAGLPFPDGLCQHGIDPAAITFVRPITLQDALWATDQAARCHDIAAVIFQVRGNPKIFDMTATRRLMLRARENGVMVFVLRHSGTAETGAAATRWHVEIAPSLPGGAGPAQGLGPAHHKITLERNRNGRTGQWMLAWDPKTRTFKYHGTPQYTSTHSVARLHAPANRPRGTDEVGQVVDFGRAS